MSRKYITLPGDLDPVTIIKYFYETPGIHSITLGRTNNGNWKLPIFSDTATFSLTYAEYARILSDCAQEILGQPVVSKKKQTFPGIVKPETIVRYVYGTLGISTISLTRTSKDNWRLQTFPTDQMVEFTFEQYQKILSGYFHDIVSLAKDGS